MSGDDHNPALDYAEEVAGKLDKKPSAIRRFFSSVSGWLRGLHDFIMEYRHPLSFYGVGLLMFALATDPDPDNIVFVGIGFLTVGFIWMLMTAFGAPKAQNQQTADEEDLGSEEEEEE